MPLGQKIAKVRLSNGYFILFNNCFYNLKGGINLIFIKVL